VPDTDTLLQVCKAIADAHRLDILRLLRSESYGVMELVRILGTQQSSVSHHLKILAEANLVRTRREGNSIFYRRSSIASDDELAGLKRSLLAVLDETTLGVDLQARRGKVHLSRAELSQEFFTRNADHLKAHQDAITDYSQYDAPINDLLDGENWPASKLAIEIGPGESELIGELARRFDQVLAVDNSREMLARTEALICRQQIHNVTPRLGQLADLKGQMSELVVLNMVLHHLSSPAGAFVEASRALGSGGRLLIVDLCHHDQDWTRRVCGDLWLGFEPTDLEAWAHAAGFEESNSAYLGLRNGFQIQARIFQLTHDHPTQPPH
jgi:DNA-binding transcriptional ArsR family regulator